MIVSKTITTCSNQKLWMTAKKSAELDNIHGKLFRECAEQLSDGFTDIFSTSLSSAVIPTCLKTTTIIPMQKTSTVSCLNDYHPITLTPIIMKCFERLFMRHIWPAATITAIISNAPQMMPLPRPSIRPLPT
ncbi:hypothetical protein QTP70_024825 [Hemibagrus guttatus]|uniref:Uncharacterized protein n=1 Tax=Hemibagrus guttatus TaxID=175788 RepID=A0AAE0UYI6_9TELE|nr:hypothetical protein QTP70_024825 [Hemibagrus guttatus]